MCYSIRVHILTAKQCYCTLQQACYQEYVKSQTNIFEYANSLTCISLRTLGKNQWLENYVRHFSTIRVDSIQRPRGQDQGQGPPSRPRPKPRTWCTKAKDLALRTKAKDLLYPCTRPNWKLNYISSYLNWCSDCRNASMQQIQTLDINHGR